MGEVIQFVPTAELERNRLIQRARAIYESVFPSVDPIGEPRKVAMADQRARVSSRYRVDERLP
jgi:hypothetical protein